MTDEDTGLQRTTRNWAALKDACRKQHPGGAGGATMCVCGAPGGGSDACSMLRELKMLLLILDSANQPEGIRKWIEQLQSAAH